MRTDAQRLAAALMLAAMVACVDQSAVAVGADDIIVQAVLDAGVPDQYVIVQSTIGAVSRQKVVTGATVTLTLPDGRVLTAAEEHDSTIVTTRSVEPKVTTIYHFALGRAGVTLTPGGTYQLRVAVPDGRVVTGATTIPNALPVTASGTTQSFNTSHDTLALEWGRVSGARGYEVLVSSSRTLFTVFADTSIVLTGNSSSGGFSAFNAGLTHQLVVIAVDAGYYDYFRKSGDEFTATGVLGNLTGGIGVFGSIVEVERRAIVAR